MLSLTAHCICLYFSRKSFVLQSTGFNASLTGENIANLIAYPAFNPGKYKISLYVSSETMAQISLLAYEMQVCQIRISFLAHTFIDDGVLAQPCVSLLAAGREGLLDTLNVTMLAFML